MNEIREYRPHAWAEVYDFYKEKFQEQYSNAFEILRAAGVHSDETLEVPNPYDTGVDEMRDFRNIGEHNVAAGVVAYKIADALFRERVIEKGTREKIVGRALIHDANKRFEIYRRDAFHKRGQSDTDVYSAEAYEAVTDKVRQMGVKGKLVEYLKDAGKETGHTSSASFVCIDEAGKVVLKADAPLKDMVVHIADDMVASPLTGQTDHSETLLVTVAERMALCKFPIRYPFLYKEGFGFDTSGQAVKVKDCNDLTLSEGLREVHPYAYWQQFIAREISKKLQALIDPENEDDPENYIKKLVNT